VQNIAILNLPGQNFSMSSASSSSSCWRSIISHRLRIAPIAAAAARAAEPPMRWKWPSQGGVNQVIRTLIYDLAQRGFVILAAEDHVIPTEKQPEPGELTPMRRACSKPCRRSRRPCAVRRSRLAALAAGTARCRYAPNRREELIGPNP
jgi:hypothetical protein